MGSLQDHIAGALLTPGSINDKLIAFFAALEGGNVGDVLTKGSSGLGLAEPLIGESVVVSKAQAVVNDVENNVTYLDDGDDESDWVHIGVGKDYEIFPAKAGTYFIVVEYQRLLAGDNAGPLQVFVQKYTQTNAADATSHGINTQTGTGYFRTFTMQTLTALQALRVRYYLTGSSGNPTVNFNVSVARIA
jgi:hypothetical protein